MPLSRKTKTLYIASFVALLGVASLGTWAWISLIRANRELDKAISDAKAAGVPWVASDLNVPKETNPKGNAGRFIEELTTNRLKDRSYISKEGRLYNGLGLRDYRLIKLAIAELEPDLLAARKAARKSELSFNTDWDRGPWLTPEIYKQTRRLIRVLCASAQVRAYDGDEDGAMSDLQDAEKLNSGLISEPTVMAFYRYYYSDFTITYCLESMATSWANSRSRLNRLLRFSEDHGRVPDVSRWTIGQTYAVTSAIRNIGTYAFISMMLAPKGGHFPICLKDPPKVVMRDGLPESFVLRALLCRHLQEWTKVANWCKSHQEPLDQYLFVHSEEKRIRSKSADYLAVKVALKKMELFFLESSFMEAMHRVRTQLIKSLLYRQAHRHFPDYLSDAGKVETDPFDGNDISYVLNDNEYRVFSVGPDRRSNYGLKESEMAKKSAYGWDIVLAYPAKFRNAPGPSHS